MKGKGFQIKVEDFEMSSRKNHGSNWEGDSQGYVNEEHSLTEKLSNQDSILGNSSVQDTSKQDLEISEMNKNNHQLVQLPNNEQKDSRMNDTLPEEK